MMSISLLIGDANLFTVLIVLWVTLDFDIRSNSKFFQF